MGNSLLGAVLLGNTKAPHHCTASYVILLENLKQNILSHAVIPFSGVLLYAVQEGFCFYPKPCELWIIYCTWWKLI